MIGPSWAYVVVALLIFAAAAAVAVVQATGSDEGPSPVQEQQVVAAESQPDAQPASPQADQPEQSVVTDEPQGEAVEQTEEPATASSVGDGDTQSAQVEPVEQDQKQESIQQAGDVAEADNPLTGFIVPIRGACITEFHNHLPGANREYRNDGVHEGLDFYEWASCAAVSYGTEILAAKAGVVVRADLDYVDITPADWDRFVAANWEGDKILDELRGRQVWIDHGRGIVTRYAHLSAIAEGIAEGVVVQQGQVIGYPGESGQREVYIDELNDIHLHFEIRVADGWLGQGEAPQEARRLYLQAFGLD